MLPPARWTRATLALLALGATLGPALDGIHTHTGTTAYPHPWVALMAWWAPLTFGAAGPAVGLMRPALERRRAAPSPLPSGARTAASLALFVLAYALSGTLPGNTARFLGLGAVFGAAWLLCDRTGLGLALAALTGLGGVVAEVALTSAGWFQHLHPDVLGVPLWLPLLYASGQVAIGNVGRRLVEA